MDQSVMRGRHGLWQEPRITPVLHPGHNSLRCPTGKTRDRWVNGLLLKYSTLPKFGFVVCLAHPGSSLRGDLVVVLIASRACGGRGSVGMRGAGRAGSPCELAAACGRAALLGFVSLVSFRLRRQGWENCGDMA